VIVGAPQPLFAEYKSRDEKSERGNYILRLVKASFFLQPSLLLLPHSRLPPLAPFFAPMAEWGPFEVTEAEIMRMEEDGLASEEVLVDGWHPLGISEPVPMLGNEEIVSFTAFHYLGCNNLRFSNTKKIPT
jgi:hypothetical protein